ncbi:hypothetical protein D6825_03205 [Candidatus Woesearchaeota archaeon]|nr:MAG: hypothetical protein D6825_03205 [Candidatus Woesearchaeota archaeon]
MIKPPEIIQFVGVSDLPAEEQETVYRISTEQYEKIRRSVNNLTELIVHIKTYHTDGERKKYSLHVRAIVPTQKPFDSSKSDDWELSRALHKAFDDIKHQIAHKFHSDVTRPRG